MRTAGNVTIHKPDQIHPGYVLYSAYAGEEFVLIDREGCVVHAWPVGGPVKIGELLPNGHLLYARMQQGVFEADWDSQPLWEFRCRQHHDFFRCANGNTIAIFNELGFNAKVRRGTLDKNDAFAEVTPAGEVAWEWHFLEHADEFAELADITFPRKGDDWAHTNTVEVLPDTPLGQRDARFAAGNVLFSSRNLHTVGVIERPSNRLVWAYGHGRLDGQHMPTMQPNGRIMLFDNGTSRKFSRVLEIDPSTDETTWEFRLPDYAFAYSMSGQEPLPNGNVLICSANQGIVMEVTREGEIVWQFRNTEVRGRREDYVTAVYRAAFCPVERVDARL